MNGTYQQYLELAHRYRTTILKDECSILLGIETASMSKGGAYQPISIYIERENAQIQA